MHASQTVGVSGLSFPIENSNTGGYSISSRLKSLLPSVLPLDESTHSLLTTFQFVPLGQTFDEQYKRFHRLVKKVFSETRDQDLFREINVEALRFSEAANTALAVKLYKCLANSKKGFYYYASRNGDVRVVIYLLKREGIENALLPTPLNVVSACIHGNIKTMQCYILIASKITKPSNKAEEHLRGIFCSSFLNGTTLVHLAIEHGQYEMATLLLQSVVKYSAVNSAGKRPLELLAEVADARIFADGEEKLYKWKPQGMTLMQTACDWKCRPLLEAVLKGAVEKYRLGDKEELIAFYRGQIFTLPSSCFELCSYKFPEGIEIICNAIIEQADSFVEFLKIVRFQDLKIIASSTFPLRALFEQHILSVVADFDLKNLVFLGTALGFVVRRDKNQILKKLVDAIVKTKFVKNPKACLELMDLLFFNNADPSLCLPLFKETILTSKKNGNFHLDLLNLMLNKSDFDLALRDKEGQTLLHLMLRSLNVSAVVLLIAHGARVDIPDLWGKTPLRLAIQISRSQPKLKLHEIVASGKGTLTEPLFLYYFLNKLPESQFGLEVVLQGRLDRLEYVKSSVFELTGNPLYQSAPSISITMHRMAKFRTVFSECLAAGKPFAQCVEIHEWDEFFSHDERHVLTQLKKGMLHGQLPTLLDKHGNSLMHRACQEGFVNFAAALLERHPAWDLEARNASALTPLMVLLKFYPELAAPFVKEVHARHISLNGVFPSGHSLISFVAYAYLEKMQAHPEIVAGVIATFQTLVDLGAAVDSYFTTALATNVQKLKPLTKVLSKKNYTLTWKHVNFVLSLPQLGNLFANVHECVVEGILGLDPEDPDIGNFKRLLAGHITREDAAPLLNLFGMLPADLRGFSANLSWEERKACIKKNWQAFFIDRIPASTPFFWIRENKKGNLAILRTKGSSDEIKACILDKPNQHPLHRIRQIFSEYLEYNYAPFYDKKFAKFTYQFETDKPQLPRFSIVFRSTHLTIHFNHLEEHFSVYCSDAREWLPKVEFYRKQLQAAYEEHQKFFTPRESGPAYAYIGDMGTDLEVFKDVPFEGIFYSLSTSRAIFCNGVWKESLVVEGLRATEEDCFNALKTYFKGIAIPVDVKLWELSAYWEKFCRWQPVFPLIGEIMDETKKTVDFFDVDFERQRLSLRMRLPAEWTFNKTPVTIENIPVWHLSKALSQHLEWQKNHFNDEIYLTAKCESTTGSGRLDLDPPDLPHVSICYLNIYFDRYMPFNTQNLALHRMNVVKVVGVLEGSLVIIGSHLTKQVSQAARMAKHIIAAFPNLEENDRLTILLEISRIGEWCLPEIHKGLRDIYSRWITKESIIRNFTADELIAEAIDLAKRAAWKCKVDELYPSQEVPDTHALTVMANLLKGGDNPITLPADLNLHSNSGDPFTVEEVAFLEANELKREFNLRVIQRIVPFLIEVYENKLRSTDLNDQKMLVSLQNHLREILMGYAPAHLTAPILALEETYKFQTEKITRQLLQIGGEIEREKERCAAVLRERDDLKRTVEALQLPGREKLLSRLSEDILFEIHYQAFQQSEFETLNKLQNTQEELFSILNDHAREREECIGQKKALLLANYGWIIDDLEQEELADANLKTLTSENIFPPFTLHMKAAVALLLDRGFISTHADHNELMKSLVEFQG